MTDRTTTTIEQQPELADYDPSAESSKPAFLNKKYSYLDASDEFQGLLAKRKSWAPDDWATEKPVKIISYFGSLPDTIGNDGDFYVDELTNMIYGPKVDGVWPEDGESAAGLCKRTFITMTGVRVQRTVAPPERGVRAWFRAVVRFFFPSNSSSKALSFRTSR